MRMLRRGDAVPHFEVRTLAGDAFAYASIWQKSNLVLAAVPTSGGGDEYALRLAAHDAEFRRLEGELVITHGEVAGLPAPGVIIADRWGEIVHLAAVSRVEDLPSPADLLDWLDYVSRRCPECEGETR